MAAIDETSYPRPDFGRVDVPWTSLNGDWDFLFDDEDVGLSELWPHHGLPGQVTVHASNEAISGQDIEAERIVQMLASLSQQPHGDSSTAEKSYKKRTIKVPFVFQTPASGIHDLGVHEVIWYERIISDLRTHAEVENGNRVLLRFGAVDYEATVWVDGQYVGSHQGGHVPFDIDITYPFQCVAAASPTISVGRLTIRVRDSAYDLSQPRGKQYWGAEPEGIFYTPSSGIWQSVWLESVPTVRIADSSHRTVLQSNNIADGELYATIAVIRRRSGQQLQVELEASIGGVLVTTTHKKELSREIDSVNVSLDMRLKPKPLKSLSTSFLMCAPLDDGRCWRNGTALWSPEHPLLYDLTLRLYDALGRIIDEVKTFIGMRSLDWMAGDGSFRLNDKPYFQALVPDQGYWAQTGITPPSPAALKADIEMSKCMGFNGCRKHQKVEDPIFLYWADKLGYVVWAEMANGFQFNNRYVERFNQEWTEASWGYPSLKDNIEQRNRIRSLYFITKTLDPTRSINDNCGWEHVCEDLITFHDYSDAPTLSQTCSSMQGILSKKSNRDIFVPPINKNPSTSDPGATSREGAPVLCTEFGGVNIAPSKDGATGGARDWGYTTASDPQDLLRRVESLVMGIVMGGLCCGFVYTQLTDIEQEVNGLYSSDRKAKLDPEKVKSILLEARRIYYNQCKGRS